MLNMQYFTHPAGYPPESGAIILWAQDGMGRPKQPRASLKIVRVYFISYILWGCRAVLGLENPTKSPKNCTWSLHFWSFRGVFSYVRDLSFSHLLPLSLQVEKGHIAPVFFSMRNGFERAKLPIHGGIILWNLNFIPHQTKTGFQLSDALFTKINLQLQIYRSWVILLGKTNLTPTL